MLGSTVEPIEIETTESGRYSLWLETGTHVDDVIRELGHEPNGYFWKGIADLLVMSPAVSLKDRCSPDSAALCAYSDDRFVLEDLAARLRKVATEPDRLRHLVHLAAATGFDD